MKKLISFLIVFLTLVFMAYSDNANSIDGHDNIGTVSAIADGSSGVLAEIDSSGRLLVKGAGGESSCEATGDEVPVDNTPMVISGILFVNKSGDDRVVIYNRHHHGSTITNTIKAVLKDSVAGKMNYVSFPGGLVIDNEVYVDITASSLSGDKSQVTRVIIYYDS